MALPYICQSRNARLRFWLRGRGGKDDMRSPLHAARILPLPLALLLAGPAVASPPFINMLFPPPGIVGPREDPSEPHALPVYPPHAAGCKETGQVKLEITI